MSSGSYDPPWRSAGSPHRGILKRIFRHWFPATEEKFGKSWWFKYRGYVALTVIVVLALGGIFSGPPALARLRCGQFSLSAGIWYDGGECVGISDGSYTFGHPAMTAVAAAGQDTDCAAGLRPQTVTIGALVTLGALNAGVRADHELEGFAAAVWQANRASGDLSSKCQYRIRLLVAQMGANEQAAVDDARDLASSGVVAVVGMGLSSQQSADAATILNDDKIPMIADVITGEGFDQDGSQADHAVFSGCQSDSSLPGVGPYWQQHWQDFFRVSYRAFTQVNDALDYVRTLPMSANYFLVQPTETNDPYTCSTLPLLTTGLANDRITNDPVKIDFDTAVPEPTQDSAASAICLAKGSVTISYTARDVYLSSFLADLIEDKKNGECTPSQITVVSQSDAEQLRVPSLFNEASRREVLTSSRLDGPNAWLRIYYTPLADPSLIGTAGKPTPPGYTDLTTAFTALGISRQDLVDGWAIMAYDSVATFATALAAPPTGMPSPHITGSYIQSQIQDLMSSVSPHPAPGADGPIRFDRNGNRIGSGPGVVRLCPLPPGASAPPLTVQPAPGQPGTCPPA
jgi:ABC-type branched-subunit amino acid transport system substrate-binding protein